MFVIPGEVELADVSLDFENLHFVQPEKRISTEQDIDEWLGSLAFRRLISFLLHVNEECRGRPLSYGPHSEVRWWRNYQCEVGGDQMSRRIHRDAFMGG